MKQKALISALFLQLTLSAQHLQWASHMSFSEYNKVDAICSDAQDNIYAVGSYWAGYHSMNREGFFFSKIDANGKLIWTEAMDSRAQPVGVFTGQDGNLTLVLNLWGGVIVQNTLISGSYQSLAYLRFNPNGELITSQVFPEIKSSGAKMDENGNILICGKYGYNSQGLSKFNNGKTLAGYGFFLSKFDYTGKCLWARQVADSNAWLSGSDGPRITTGPGPFSVLYLKSNYAPFYLDHYNTDGDLVKSGWVDWANFASDNSGNLFRMYNDISKITTTNDTVWVYKGSGQGFIKVAVDASDNIFSSEFGRNVNDPNQYSTMLRKHDQNTGLVNWDFKAENMLVEGWANGDGHLYGFGIDSIYSGDQGFHGPAVVFRLGSTPATAIKEHTIYESMVSPNPCSGIVKISYPADCKICVLTLQGNVIYKTQVIGSGSTMLDLSQFGSGVYLLQTEKDGQVQTQKLLVEN